MNLTSLLLSGLELLRNTVNEHTPFEKHPNEFDQPVFWVKLCFCALFLYVFIELLLRATRLLSVLCWFLFLFSVGGLGFVTLRSADYQALDALCRQFIQRTGELVASLFA